MVGVTLIELSVASLTPSVVVPLSALREAVMVTVPLATALAMPTEPAALEMVARLTFEEAQVTWAEISAVVLSE